MKAIYTDKEALMSHLQMKINKLQMEYNKKVKELNEEVDAIREEIFSKQSLLVKWGWKEQKYDTVRDTPHAPWVRYKDTKKLLKNKCDYNNFFLLESMYDGTRNIQKDITRCFEQIETLGVSNAQQWEIDL